MDVQSRLSGRRPTHRQLAAAQALLAALVVFLIATEIFPYHTSNHDEGVYLQQAAMLLDGTLTMEPPLVEPFRPWFFVVDGESMYPKYTPVPAAMFAVGKLLGGYRIALAVVAGCVVALSYAITAEAFDRPTGVVAGLVMFASPLFLLDASVFLPYVPTLAWLLLFGWAYLRSDRTGDRRFAAVAGIAIGVGFFARPYTAVLFAIPFIAHALWTLREFERDPLVRHGLTATLGLCGVAVTLGYNAIMTGSPFLFPYEAFAPADGLGFGEREILGYERDYTPALALEASARNLTQYVTEWSAAPPFGALLAVGGIGSVLARGRRVDPRKLVLAGLVASVILGQLYFWGTVNLLGSLSDPTDGLISYLGPYYHVSLLVPTATFAGHALLTGGRRLRARIEAADRRAFRVAAVGVVVLASVGVGATAVGAVNEPLADNYDVTRQYERAYEPFEERDFENALVFLPTPYGDWLNHPFQHLRNDPDLDGETVYALQEEQFGVVDAFPDRTVYRYVYHGEWLPYAGESVTPRIERVRAASGNRVELAINASVPEFTQSVSLRAEADENGYRAIDPDGDAYTLTVTFLDGRAVLDSPSIDEPLILGVEDDDLDVRLFADSGSVSSYTYDVSVPHQYRAETGTHRVLSPRLEACRNPRLCGGEAAYIPGRTDGVRLNATLRTIESETEP